MSDESAMDPDFLVEVILYGLVEGGYLREHGPKTREALIAAADATINCSLQNQEPGDHDHQVLSSILKDDDLKAAFACHAYANGWVRGGGSLFEGIVLDSYDPDYDLAAAVLRHFHPTHPYHNEIETQREATV